MSITLITYIDALRIKIRDKGVSEHEELIGNGMLKKFYLNNIPIKLGSLDVYINDVVTTAFTIDYDTGLLTFATAPIDEAVIKVYYISYIFSDTELVALLEKAIRAGMRLWDGETFTIGGISPDSYINIAPSGDVLDLWALLFLRYLKTDNILYDSGRSISYRRADDVAVDKRNIVRDSIASVEMLDIVIRHQVWDMTFNSIGGYAICAGDEPFQYYDTSVGESYVPEEDY